MNRESTLVYELWDLIKDNLTNSRKQSFATEMLRTFESNGYEADDLRDLVDEDQYLANAYREVYEYEDDEPDDDYWFED